MQAELEPRGETREECTVTEALQGAARAGPEACSPPSALPRGSSEKWGTRMEMDGLSLWTAL